MKIVIDCEESGLSVFKCFLIIVRFAKISVDFVTVVVNLCLVKLQKSDSGGQLRNGS